MPEIGAPKGVTKHTDLTDKEVASVIDHAASSITPAKLRAVDSPANDEVPAYNAIQGLFEWKARGAMTLHDKTYHTSPTLPDNDAHKTASPVDHPDGSITNAKIVAAAGIPYSKLSLALSILNADIASAAAIAYAKLALAGALKPTDLSATNSPADTQVPSYNAASNLFKWVTAGGGLTSGKYLNIWSAQDNRSSDLDVSWSNWAILNDYGFPESYFNVGDFHMTGYPVKVRLVASLNPAGSMLYVKVTSQLPGGSIRDLVQISSDYAGWITVDSGWIDPINAIPETGPSSYAFWAKSDWAGFIGRPAAFIIALKVP